MGSFPEMYNDPTKLPGLGSLWVFITFTFAVTRLQIAQGEEINNIEPYSAVNVLVNIED